MISQRYYIKMRNNIYKIENKVKYKDKIISAKKTKIKI